MRQAGRHLPEYRKIREKEKNFIHLCLNSDKAAEITLQPVKRYNVDAAIVFSDILIVPYSMKRSVHFIEKKGPILDPVKIDEIEDLQFDETCYQKIGETIQKVRRELPKEKSVIGFAGAPWTVATYMIEGGGSKNKAKAIEFALKEKDSMQHLLDKITEATILYLEYQVKSGADVIKLFESWASNLPEILHEMLLFNPVKKIIKGLRKKGVNIPIITFPRGLGPNYRKYAKQVPSQAIATDSSLPLYWIKTHLQTLQIVQGNLDPLVLLAGGEVMRQNIRQIREILQDHPYIFNLGHGILPETPIENVHEMIELVQL